MKQDKITIDKDTVKGLDRSQLENVLFAVYNDNLAFKRRIQELEAMVAELKEFKNLANAEKYTPSSEAIQGLFPELEVMITYSDPIEDDKQSEEVGPRKENKPRKPRRPNLVLPANSDVSIIDKTIGVPESKTVDGGVTQHEWIAKLQGEAVVGIGIIVCTRACKIGCGV